MSDFIVRKTNLTEYVRSYSERELMEIAAKDLRARVEREVGRLETSVDDKVSAKSVVDFRKDMNGPYIEFVVTIGVDHGSTGS